MEEDKVISSKITRDYKPLQNNLYDLVTVEPAVQISPGDVKDHSCDFKPVIGKIYVPKKRIKFKKVKTVRDIRNEFEYDISLELSKDLEKQQNYLLKKITCGSSREENTKDIARNMLKCGKPISRYSWQMLMNVNPEAHLHAIQYVLWNGKRIRVNGSKGGKNTFLCNYDLANIKKPLKKQAKQKTYNLKKSLLQNSLTVKFKPGPLTRKISLDDSFQKYNVGKTELLNLPKPGLHIQSLYGVSLEPMISDFIQGLRDSDGTISEKWAEFAVSVLGTVRNDGPVQNDGSDTTFELNYKCNQQRMLLRRDVVNTSVELTKTDAMEVITHNTEETDLVSEVENILKKMIDSVEISSQQDSFLINEDEHAERSYNVPENFHCATKDKSNKRRFCELDRLDVTVIRLPHVAENGFSKSCQNAHCSLGCICPSLQCSYNLRQHCGRLDCMFECKCDFSKYKVTDTFNSDYSELIPGLMNLDNKLNSKLAKEEQKFHQTVVLTGEKSILLKSEKRNWKASKRYGNFYDSMCLKNDVKSQRLLSVVSIKLNCANVEPWCMVHKLYKCFCKCKFTQNSITKVDNDINEAICHENETSLTKSPTDFKDKKRPRTEKISTEKIPVDINKYNCNDSYETIKLNSDNTTCARSIPYIGRKYSDEYYFNTNTKILEMEKNDDRLRKRMLTILNKEEDIDASNPSSKTTSPKLDVHEVQVNIEITDENRLFDNIQSSCANEMPDCESLALQPSSNKKVSDELSSKLNLSPDRSILHTSANKSKLITWLESSYKQYKQRIEQGIVKKSLDPPRHGKVALYPWEFILGRYRERKNLFLISNKKPFRIFMAVDSSNAFFENCTNIDEIRFADLHKYPLTVKNLLTNATDLKDNFCILCGLAICWELIGSVTKLDDQTTDTDQLRSVGDDRKIGFVARRKENNFEKSDNTDDNSDNYFMEKDENPVNATVQSKMITRNKKRKSNTSKMTNSSSKKSTWVTSHEVKNISTSMQNKYSDSDTDKDHNFKEVLPENSSLLSAEALCTDIITKDVQPQDFLLESEGQAELCSQSSKWFVMTIEHDFSEIQFFNRGFFVKFVSIMKAINVARLSGKTVRLSPQKVGDQCNNPQFGIYAIPKSSANCVFIGPYDKDESLGINTVKSFAELRESKKTRGVWITTKKVDNVKVIDNPLSFMPSNLDKTVSLENTMFSNKSIEDDEESRSSHSSNDLEASVSVIKDTELKDHAKIVKPVTIRKTNGFYHLAPQGFLTKVLPESLDRASTSTVSNSADNLRQPIQLLRQLQSERRPVNFPLMTVPIPRLPLIYPRKQTSQSLLKKLVSDDRLQTSKPVAEIAPQIKIVDVYSETTTRTRGTTQSCGTAQSGSTTETAGRRPEVSMFILKPEEINERLMEITLASQAQRPLNNDSNINTTTESSVDQDIENFLATSTVYVPPNADIFEISDEDDDNPVPCSIRTVWIECETAQLGYIKGRKNADNMLSFEFPGFKFTDFYPEQEAFLKINQVLSRKVYVPKYIHLTWRVVEKVEDLKMKYELKSDCLGTDFVLTRRGIRHKKSMVGDKSFLKTDASVETGAGASAAAVPGSKTETQEVEKTINYISELEERSKALDEESEKLMYEMATITKDAIQSFVIP